MKIVPSVYKKSHPDRQWKALLFEVVFYVMDAWNVIVSCFMYVGYNIQLLVCGHIQIQGDCY